MANDNVDVFKKIIFSIPSSTKLTAALTLFGLFYGLAFFTSLKLFAANLLTVSSLEVVLAPVLGLNVFILPAFVSGELFYRFLSDYPRNWGYFLAFCNQLIIFIYSLILSGANSMGNAWSILWLGLITIFLSNLLVLLLTLGYSHIKRISLLSFIHPLIVLSSFHLFLGSRLQIPLETYALNLTLLPVSGGLLLLIAGIAEYLLRANVSNVSVMGLSAGLLQKKQESLDLGYPTNPDVQTLQIENRDGEITVSVPWVHPGPLEGFGGGQLTTDIIEELNTGSEGFFLHVPSTHKSDPTDPESYRKILDAMDEPENTGEVSKLVTREYDGFTFHGRKVDGKKIVYIYSDRFDDYELPIFHEVIDTDEVLLVDRHCDDEDETAEEREELWYNTQDARNARNNLREFLELLEEQKTGEYKAGFITDLEGTPKFALVEEVDGQETLLFGIEGNGVTAGMRNMEREYRKEFDSVITFTTDTHRSIHELNSYDDVDTDRFRELVEDARENVSPGQIGFQCKEAETMNLLQEDYHGLVFSINILTRLLPLTLLLLYILLVIWVV